MSEIQPGGLPCTIEGQALKFKEQMTPDMIDSYCACIGMTTLSIGEVLMAVSLWKDRKSKRSGRSHQG